MKTNEYKQICKQPNAFSRHYFEVTEKVLSENNFPIALRLSEILQNPPITKPENHKGGEATDYFLVDLSESETDKIVDIFTELEVVSIGSNGATTPLATFYGEVADKWINYLSIIESQ